MAAEEEEEEEVFTLSKQKIEVDAALGQKKLYYIHADIVDKNYNLEYKIYCLDHLSHQTSCGDDVQDMPAPILTLERYKYASWVGFGALGSKIYMVGGSKYTTTTIKVVNRRRTLVRFGGRIKYTTTTKVVRRRRKLEFKPVVDVYIFDTRLGVGRMSVGPPLRSPVYDEPIVIPVKGKLYVMPRSLVSGRRNRGDVRSFIQVLDPSANSWSVIEFPSIMWKAGREFDIPDDDDNPYEIVGHAVSDSKILLYTMLTHLYGCSGVFVYNTETCGWRVKNLSPNVERLAFTERYYLWDSRRIWGASYVASGILGFFHMFDEEETIWKLSKLSCCHNKQPFLEKDSRVIDIAPGYVVVMSRCWMKQKRRLLQLRLHYLKICFQQRGGKKASWISECQVLKCITLQNNLLYDDVGPTHGLYYCKQMYDWKDYCLFI